LKEKTMKFINHWHFLTITIFTMIASGCKQASLLSKASFKGNAYYLMQKETMSALATKPVHGRALKS
jgi:hypothetical protein